MESPQVHVVSSSDEKPKEVSAKLTNGGPDHEPLKNGVSSEEVANDKAHVEGSLINATENNENKMFVGGLSWDTVTEGLKDYFKQFGDVQDCTIKKDSKTNKSRGFGFVLFANKESVEKVLSTCEHLLDGRKIDPKRAEAIRKDGKLFVGGIKTETDNEKIKEYFSNFGEIETMERPTDKTTGKNRGFCFITFKKDGVIRECCAESEHKLDGQTIDVKEAVNQMGRNQRGFMGRGHFMGNRGWSGPWPTPGFGLYGYDGMGYNNGYNNFQYNNYNNGYNNHYKNKGRGDANRTNGGNGNWGNRNQNNWNGSNGTTRPNNGRYNSYQNYHDY